MAFCAHCGSQVAEVSYRACASCGNPTNGAPRPPLATGGKNSFTIAIVAVVLALLAIPIAGILAAIAIPNLLTAMQRSKEKRTLADIRDIARGLEQQASEKGSYPQSLDPSRKDGWGTALRYECIADGERPCATYAITSGGKDLRFEHESAREYTQGATTKFDCDIVFANGSFVQYPEGVLP